MVNYILNISLEVHLHSVEDTLKLTHYAEDVVE
jgi:hypothetical protein